MNFNKRSYEPELMDDLEMEGEELASTLKQIAMVNKWLGGTAVIISGLKKILKQQQKSAAPIRIIDLGCGGGEILRKIANWGREKGYKFELTGIDANAYIVDYAKRNSKNYSEIRYQQLNVFSENFGKMNYDIALCSLFLHHFTDEEIVILLQKMYTSASMGILVNDLHRSRLAHSLFHLITKMLAASAMVCYDGKLSIRRAFKRKELIDYMKKINCSAYQLQWKWAFRYQLSISTS